MVSTTSALPSREPTPGPGLEEPQLDWELKSKYAATIKTLLVADDVSVSSAKAVIGLLSVIRNRHTTTLFSAPNQGSHARGLMLESKSNDIARLISIRTRLNFENCELIHRARLGILPLHGVPGCQPNDKSCLRCGCQLETTAELKCL